MGPFIKSEIETIRQNLKNPDIVNTSFKIYDDTSRFLLDLFFEHSGSVALPLITRFQYPQKSSGFTLKVSQASSLIYRSICKIVIEKSFDLKCVHYKYLMKN